MPQEKGIICSVHASKGFGFIRLVDGHKQYFFHCSNVATNHPFATLQIGQEVSFLLRPSSQKPGTQEAANVKPVNVAANDPAALPQQFMLPYGFVRIDLERNVTGTPVWHDGSCGGELHSGEIRCTLETLTPLLPGNMRYKASQADPTKPRTWGFADLADNKQIAEPLRLPDGRVVIAGSALKGMLRHSLGALLSAPMERVAEHHYTYRPNLDLRGNQNKLIVRPAMVTASKNGGWQVEVFDDARAAIFIRQDAEAIIRKNTKINVVNGIINGVKKENQHILACAAGSVTLDHSIALYKGGIDGEGLLAEAFKKKENPKARGPFTYHIALVPKSGVCTLEISAALYQHYLRGQQILADSNHGHLTAHTLKLDVKEVEKVKDSINKHSQLQTGQLIYVEIQPDSLGKITTNARIVSFGHHFRYRWAYTSSVRNSNGKPRACLTPSACEQVPATWAGAAEYAPEKLSGARLLFGYVRNDEKNPIGKGVFERMAGRIAINHAVSVGVPKFLGQNSGYCVPLKILGSPKSSAWEFYLRQPQDTSQAPLTYGDLPGDAGGELADRKFYRHWLQVTEEDIKATDEATIKSEQATLARFICQKDTRFKFTIRFARLRDWELGALLAVLQPHRLVSGAHLEQYAHKLGLGRPLGMGSVRISEIKIKARLEKETSFSSLDEQKMLDALKTKICGANLHDWLAVHDCKSHWPLAYPEGTFIWHTDIRRQYSKLRREISAQWKSLREKINNAMGG